MNNDSTAVHATPFVRHFFESVCLEKDSAFRILSLLYPDGAKCVSCGARIEGGRAADTFWLGKRTYCKCCDSKFTPTSGTIIEGAHLSFSQIEVLFVLISLGIDHKRIATMGGCHEDTVATWHAKITFWESHV